MTLPELYPETLDFAWSHMAICQRVNLESLQEQDP